MANILFCERQNMFSEAVVENLQSYHNVTFWGITDHLRNGSSSNLYSLVGQVEESGFDMLITTADHRSPRGGKY